MPIRTLAALAAVITACAVGAARAACPSPIPPNMKIVTHLALTDLGLKADRYTWHDSQCLVRTVILKQEGNGNPGHGGYAISMSYQVLAGGTASTIIARAAKTDDGGFGYFVSHERYRSFTDGDYDTIAHKIFHVDDSPLGLDFPVVGTILPPTATAAAHRFTTTYHHYGTITPIPKDADGNDVAATPVSPSAFKNYPMPITLTWVFQAQTDAPRLDVSVDLSGIGKPDLANFDLRGPYGVMLFDNSVDGTIAQAMWGDRYHFTTLTQPATRDTAWTWNKANGGARYSALIAGGYEMGLYENKPFAHSALADGYSDGRGTTSASYTCTSQGEILPCDYEWPYQSIQYSLPYKSASDPNADHQPTNFKKMAWGSSAFYGTGTSLPNVYDTGTSSEVFVGFPTSKKISYSICILLGKTITGGLTKAAALAAKPNCASAVFD